MSIVRHEIRQISDENRGQPINGSSEVEKLIDASQHLSSLGFDIPNNRIGGDAGEIGDIAVNDCLADRQITSTKRPGLDR